MSPAEGLHCLVATDLSARGDRALVRGFRMAAASKGSVVVLHVVEDTYPPALLKTIGDNVRILLDQQIRAMPESEGVTWRVEVVSGHDFEETPCVRPVVQGPSNSITCQEGGLG